MEVECVSVENPDALDVIVGQAHFLKTVEGLEDAVSSVHPPVSFGIAFCESSGPRLIRRAGTDDELVALAVRNAQAVGAGHSFVVVLGDGHARQVLNAIKAVPEVCNVFCATANPLEILVLDTDAGRGIVGVVDGKPPLGVETDVDAAQRRKLLQRLGYE
jgi:uncharacterized protein